MPIHRKIFHKKTVFTFRPHTTANGMALPAADISQDVVGEMPHLHTILSFGPSAFKLATRF